MSNTEELDRTLERAERLIPLLGSSNQTGTSTITVNAGGIGVWLAASCCAVAVAVCFVGAVFVSALINDLNRQTQELRQKDEIHDAYFSAGYGSPKKEGSKE